MMNLPFVITIDSISNYFRWLSWIW